MLFIDPAVPFENINNLSWQLFLNTNPKKTLRIPHYVLCHHETIKTRTYLLIMVITAVHSTESSVERWMGMCHNQMALVHTTMKYTHVDKLNLRKRVTYPSSLEHKCMVAAMLHGSLFIFEIEFTHLPVK
jgi:hypothetical protein